jgi:hypothetical protein
MNRLLIQPLRVVASVFFSGTLAFMCHSAFLASLVCALPAEGADALANRQKDVAESKEVRSDAIRTHLLE